MTKLLGFKTVDNIRMKTTDTKNASLGKVLAGIVLFNPDIERLQQNINAIKGQVDKLILVDNGSTDTQYKKLLDISDVEYVGNDSNKGIAFALNQILQYAYDNDYSWALTLDQDSVVAQNLMSVYSGIAKKDEVGIVCCKTIDRNFTELHQNEIEPDREVRYCITSASLTNVEAWKKTGGFDESMFIDWVDWDICIALRHHGYKIIKTDRTHILHELGTNTRIKRVGKYQFLILNRSSFRYYYVSRNWIYLGRKWKEENLTVKLLQVIKMLLIAMVYESNKWENLKAFVKGTLDGFKMKTREK